MNGNEVENENKSESENESSEETETIEKKIAGITKVMKVTAEKMKIKVKVKTKVQKKLKQLKKKIVGITKLMKVTVEKMKTKVKVKMKVQKKLKQLKKKIAGITKLMKVTAEKKMTVTAPKTSSGETDSHESESSSDTDSDTDSNEADIDKLKPKSTWSGSKITFKCPVCCFRCPSSGRIYGHMVKEHGAKKFQCEKCDFSTENKTSLLNHIRYYCKGCGLKPKRFLTKRKVPTRQVKMPKQKVVCKKVLFFCEYCDHSGKSSGIVFAYMCKEHGIEPFKCSKCKFATGNKTSFYNHITRYCKK